MSSHTRRVLVALAATAAVSNIFAADFGRTRGSFSVSPSGAATYTIPIWTPPGPNNITPSISLSYNSQEGNGLVGLGWNLNAVSSIERCARTVGQDGGAAAVELNVNDRFCIDGKRLRISSGTYGAANSVYFTEIADYARVKSFSYSGGGEYFVVEAKSGLRYEYGNSPTSRVVVGGATLRWMLNKVYDRNDATSPNNYIVTYLSSAGFAVPDSIYWTPTYLGSTTYRYEAKFNYINSRTNSDSYLGQVAGYAAINRYRLENIQIKSAGTVVRRYRLNYSTGTTSRSLLTSVKECADDLEQNCLLPIAFNYQAGFAGVAAGYATPPSGSSNGIQMGRYDFNGDGKDDLLYKNGSTWQVSTGAGSGFGGPFNTSITGAVLVGRFLPNGRDGIATIVSGNLWVYRWDDASAAFVGHNTGIASVLPKAAVDYSGDGLADLIYVPGGATMNFRRNNSTGSGNPSFENTTTSATLSSGATWGQVWSYNNNGLQRADVNGDGRQDAYAIVVYPIYNGQGQQVGAQPYAAGLLGAGTVMNLTPQATWVAGGNPVWPSLRFNDDQCTDRQIGNTILVAQCNGIASSTIATPAAPLLLLDWNGDGRTDLFANNGGTFGVYLSTGDGFSALIPTTIPSAGTFFAMDQDGDGLEDLVRVNGTSAISYWTHTSGYVGNDFLTNLPDVLMSVVDGFGVTQSISYGSTSQSVFYGSGTDTVYPLIKEPARTVVARVTSSNGIGGLFHDSYFYSGARQNWLRKEFAGFQRVDRTDSRNGLIARTYFDQLFPISGLVSQTELMQSNGVTPVSRVVNTNTFTVLDATSNNQRYFTYTSGSTVTRYEVGGTWNGNLLTTVVTSNLYETTGGTLYDRTVTTTEPASGANGVTAGGSWVARTLLPTADLLNDITNWCLGRPRKLQQINSNSLGYGTAITRTTDITWDPAFCRPTQFIDEQGSGTLQVTTALGYDGFGNVNSTTVTGTGMAARTTTTSYLDSTFTTGQFPLSVTNALSQTSTMAWNYELAVPASVTDPNGLLTGWLYDAFGRRTRENRPDGTATTWSIENCEVYWGAGNCPSLYKTTTIVTARDTSNVRITDVWAHLDAFDRPLGVFHRTLGDPGSLYSAVAYQYDALGRTAHEDSPCLTATCAGHGNSYTYDLIGRPTAITRPISDSNLTTQTTTIGYEGLSTRVTDPQGIWSVKTFQANGWLARTTDRDSYINQFDYDGFGNVVRVNDQGSGNVLQTSTYNIRGMLTQRVDLDMGTWVYDPNALGEVLHIRDAKTGAPNWTQTLTYDPLGRRTSRAEAEGTSTWTWGALSDNTATNKYVGRLKSVSGPGYSESYVYDAFGRPSTTTISADTTYQIDYSYGIHGLLQGLTFPTTTNSCRLALQFGYLNGLLKTITNISNATQCGSTGEVFWEANKGGANHQPTRETLANGLVTNREFDITTGWLKSITTGAGGGTGVQNLAYTWDLVGNLATRKDVNQSNLTESFSYDNLYRLTGTTLSTGPSLSYGYDALGNLTSQTGVGAYTYHGTKKHQVTSTANGWSFGYDANGNMTSGRGASIDWTSYNYPSCIRLGASCSGTSADYSSFSYTPDRQYWKQQSNYVSGGQATTIYVGGLLEKVTTSGGTEYRHMIRAGGSTIIVSRQSSGTNGVYYITSDHLGSSSAITNSSGGILVNSSFGPFGARRGANWTGSPSALDWTAIAGTTRRGFTEHTMLDNLNLTNMNGRVYDQMLGRFVSADPYIPDAFSTQSYNRYSYTQNNPLSFTDPSGFDDTRKFPAPGFTCDTNPLLCLNLWPGRANECMSYACRYLGGQLGLGSMTALSEAERHRAPPPGSQVPTDSNGAWSACVRPEAANSSAFVRGFHTKVDDHSALPSANQISQVPALVVASLVRSSLRKSIGDSVAVFRSYGDNPLTGEFLTQGELNDAKMLNALNVMSAGLAAEVSSIARGVKAFSGTAYEFGQNAKHLEGTLQANRLIAREGAAHVFTDMNTLATVENALFGEQGTFTGTARGFERFGIMFDSPIGARISADGTRIPLFYGEAKVSPEGVYHVIPRTGPATP